MLKNNPFVEWFDDTRGLPAFRLRESYPIEEFDADGKPVAYSNDPYALVGNEALTLFARLSGELLLLSGQCGWASLNFAGSPNRGENRAVLHFNGQEIDLLKHPLTKATFGVGFAKWITESDDWKVVRGVSCQPGYSPSLCFEVSVENKTEANAAYKYEEAIHACYMPLSLQRKTDQERPVHYSVEKDTGTPGIKFVVESVRCPLEIGGPDKISPFDSDPPKMLLSGEGTFVRHNQLGAEREGKLSPGEIASSKWNLHIEHSEKPIGNTICRWEDRIPELPDEADETIRRELRWHIACLESMATWSAPYRETFIPQGCSYDYDIGVTASRRDLMQHGMAALVWRPEWVASTLRLCFKAMTPQGEIRLMDDGGAASTTNWFFQTSDQQLYLFWLLANYLRRTNDFTILENKVAAYPPGLTTEVDGLTHVERAFGWIIHQVGFGPNGLLRLLCSDWNDCIYFFQKEKAYPDIFMTAESTLNAAMAVFVCSHLAEALPNDDSRYTSLRQSLVWLAENQNAALKKVGCGQRFLPRAFVEGKPWGADDLFLEPQIFALLNPYTEREAKLELWGEIKNRVMKGEALGARQRESPPNYDRFSSGNRENGGIWYALNGPLVLAVAEIAPEDAYQIFQKMTLKNHAQAFPAQWPGQWSGPDNYESSLRPTSGMPDPEWIWSDMPIYCAHSHAWPLLAWEATCSTSRRFR